MISTILKHFWGAALAAAAVAMLASAQPIHAADKAGIAADAYTTLQNARADSRSIREIADKAVAALVIPDIVKAGFVIGGAYGEGALIISGRAVSYWSYAAASIGYQAGAQKTSQILFFMTEEALASFQRRRGFEVGADAEVTVIDGGAEASIDTTAQTQPVIAVVLDRRGLLAGASLQGGKYSPLD